MPPKKGKPPTKKKEGQSSSVRAPEERVDKDSTSRPGKGKCVEVTGGSKQDGRSEAKGKKRHTSLVSPARKRSTSPIYSDDSSDSEVLSPKKKQRKDKHEECTRARSVSPIQLPDDLPDLPPIDDRYSTPEGKSSGQGKRWTPKKESLLAAMWEDEPHLYDSLVDDYKNSYKRKQTLLRFSAALNIPVHDIDTHMNSMRTQYTKALQVPSGSSADRLTHRQRELKALLSFLKKHVKPLKGLSNLPKTDSKPVPVPVRAQPSTCRQADDALDFYDPPGGDPSCSITKPRRQLNLDDDDNSSTYSHGQNRKYPKKDTDNVSTAMGAISTSMTTMARVFAERNGPGPRQDEAQDSHGIWCKLLAIKLRQIPYHQAERLKHKIDGMILDSMEED